MHDPLLVHVADGPAYLRDTGQWGDETAEAPRVRAGCVEFKRRGKRQQERTRADVWESG